MSARDAFVMVAPACLLRLSDNRWLMRSNSDAPAPEKSDPDRRQTGLRNPRPAGSADEGQPGRPRRQPIPYVLRMEFSGAGACHRSIYRTCRWCDRLRHRVSVTRIGLVAT